MIDLLLGMAPSMAGDRREQVLYLLTLGLLVFGTVLCLVALRVAVFDVLAVAIACVGMSAWLLSNSPGEGGTLWEVFHGNGVTLADLAAVPAGGLVAVLCWRRATRR